MALYKVTSPDGRAVTIRGDTPPTDADLEPIFANLPQKQSHSLMDAALSGGAGYGAEAVKQGLGLKDLPYIVAKGVSGLGQGMPEEIAKKPMKFGLSGTIGLGLDRYAPDEKNQLPFPKPDSEGGKMIGNAAQMVTSTLPVESLGLEGVQGALGLKKASDIESMSNVGEKYLPKAKALAENLYGQSEEARKTAGAMQGGYIDANAAEQVDPVKFQATIDALPKDVQEAIYKNPDIQITNGKELKEGFDPLGVKTSQEVDSNPTIAPTLKNAETVRSLIKGKVPSSYFHDPIGNPGSYNLAEKGYSDIGNLMTEGRPELNEAMENYAKVMGAQDQLNPKIMSGAGFIKPKGALGLYGKNAAGENIEATKVLGEHNPDIYKAADDLRDLSNKIQRGKFYKTLAKRAGWLTGAGALAHEEWRHFK